MFAVTMSEKEAGVRLTVTIPASTKRKFKATAANVGLEMKELALLLIEFAIPLIDAEKTPPELDKAIKRLQAKKPGN